MHWVSAAHAEDVCVALYDRLFTAPVPGEATGEPLDDLAPVSRELLTGCKAEPALAEARVAVLALGDRGRGPLVMPVWYFYEPGGEIVFLTPRASRKGKLLAEGRRISLCVQVEEPPYRYVSVEGPVVAVDAADLEADLLPIAIRYLGEAEGRAYTEGMRAAFAATPRLRARWEAEECPWLRLSLARTCLSLGELEPVRAFARRVAAAGVQVPAAVPGTKSSERSQWISSATAYTKVSVPSNPGSGS